MEFHPNIQCCSRSINAANTVQCANMRLYSVGLGWACFKCQPADLSMFGFDTHALARTHRLFCSLFTGLTLALLSTHRTWHAIIITSQQTNKYRFRVRKVVPLLGQILFRRNVLASRYWWMIPIQNTNINKKKKKTQKGLSFYSASLHESIAIAPSDHFIKIHTHEMSIVGQRCFFLWDNRLFFVTEYSLCASAGAASWAYDAL